MLRNRSGKPSHRKLHLHRELLRVLSPAALEKAAGGFSTIGSLCGCATFAPPSFSMDDPECDGTGERI